MPPAATASLAHALASQPETVSGAVTGPIAVWYQGVKMATTTTSALITVSTDGKQQRAGSRHRPSLAAWRGSGGART